MTWTRVVIAGAVVAIAAAYFAGFWPERQRVNDAEARVQALEGRAEAAEANVRLAQILGQLLRVQDALEARNFGDAALQASLYFDRVGEEIPRAVEPVAQTLTGIQRTRDLVTAALARTEPGVADVLKEQQVALRRALGYSLP